MEKNTGSTWAKLRKKIMFYDTIPKMELRGLNQMNCPRHVTKIYNSTSALVIEAPH